MKFTTATVAGAMAGVAMAQRVSFTNTNYDVAANVPYNLTWAGVDGQAVTLLLKSGESTNLKTVDTLAAGETKSFFVWTPPSSLSSCDLYAFEIQQGSETNFSPQFPITGLAACTTTTSSTPSTSTTPSASGSSSDSSASSKGAVSSSSSTTSAPSGHITGLANSTSAMNQPGMMSGTISLSTTGRTTATGTAPTGAATSPVNINNGQRTSYSPVVILLASVAGLLFLN